MGMITYLFRKEKYKYTLEKHGHSVFK